MEGVLAELLLSQSRDPQALLRALCRGEASAERVETLRFLLQRLEEDEARGGAQGGGALPEAAREVAMGYLVPLLRGCPDPGPDARRCRRFWRTVQAGLGCAEDGLARKRARFLLRRALDVSAGQDDCACACGSEDPDGPSLFWWSEKKKDELLKFWENYILIMETLEGNQIHVIKPVLPKLNGLFDCAVSEETGSWLFHPSWHVCIYKRMLESESKVLTKEAVTHFLELYGSRRLPSSPAFSEFVIGPLMDALSESSLYSRSPGQPAGSAAPLGCKLQTFLVTYVSLLPEEIKSSFLLSFIRKMTSRHWSAVPILSLSKALASVPRCGALGVDGLLALRGVIHRTTVTHQVLLRGAAQCYLLKTAMNLVDVEKVALSDVSMFLVSLRPEESLGRGTSLWTELCDWLRVNERRFRCAPPCSPVGPPETSLNAYVKSLVLDYIKAPPWEPGDSGALPDGSQARLVALMVMLAVDVEGAKTQHSEKQRTENVLRLFLDPLLDALGMLGANAYMPLPKTDRCLQVLVKLLHTCVWKGPGAADDEVLPLLQSLVLSTAESVSEFILRRLTARELSSVSDLDRCRLYLLVLVELVTLHRLAGWKRGNPVWRVISPLQKASVRHLQEEDGNQEPTLGDQIQRVVSMASLAMVCEVIGQTPELQLETLEPGPVERFLSSLPLTQVLQKPRMGPQSSSVEEPPSAHGWGKVTAQYIHDQGKWVCLECLLRKRHTLIPGTEGEVPGPELPAVQQLARTLQAALDALAVLPAERVLPVLRCMHILVPMLLTSSESLCVESFDVAWKTVSSLSNTQLTFWPNLKAFVQLVFDNRVLTIAARVKGQAYLKIKEIMFKVIEMSAVRAGVLNTLTNHCCRSWLESAPGVARGPLSCAGSYSELVLEACVFGTVLRRDQRLIQDAQDFIESLGHDCAANVVIEKTNREDPYVRICAVKFLCLLDGANVSHKLLMEDLAVRLLEKDELVSRPKSRSHANSLQHRLKNRAWQTLLVLVPRLDQNFLNRIIDKIFQAGSTNNQASIKYFVEWIIILILHKFPQFLPKFWDCFSRGEEKLKTSICTFLSVLSHLDIIIQNNSEKKAVLQQALVAALRWCFSHSFSVRLYALVALKKIWSLCKTLCVEECDALASAIESSLSHVESMHREGKAQKNWQRIQDHFFFTVFHPLQDYSLETIFYTLPRLSGLAEDEWVTIDKFTGFTELPASAGFQWHLSRTRLRQLEPGDWSQQDVGAHSGEADDPSEWADVQKKVIPWENSVPDADSELPPQGRAARLRKSVSRLIVVASLTDKATNLGGLCRTCEVFGASALVVGNLQCVHDRQFQALSVSAEQWLPLVEVRPHQLTDYLQRKKAEGYTIIGVEQTARSVDLTQYCFPEKSLLLLGNEREGIPANLIQQLDVCVEIPQHGITRSLNVHVSGALLTWEYTRQRLPGRSHGPAGPAPRPPDYPCHGDRQLR
ncbi:LOW QUALITY PROTEIN: probable methyltransferase TARBP1 [Tupaia chinensis]|uniref:LOW QUALITY PROTEIN: probable methyltransferase TARBP1 n=1 Tax=Tupaia chinensis TaxID=246437 RepID=UPI000FFB514C|nr:LOW QUALITY PROTEIN: probable methyltransferase TARBP1 [Tupaia chinensis]